VCMKRLGVVFVAIGVLGATSRAAARDYARTAFGIVPSGQYGGVPAPPEATDQALMYDALTPLFNRVTPADLKRTFKSEALGTKGQGALTRERVPRKGVSILYDGHHVPHITGKTDDDVTWGAGWAIAKDRALLLEQARYNSRVAAVDVPGIEAIDLITNLRSFKPSSQTEREVAKEGKLLRDYGKQGRRLLHDIDVYVDGINAYLKSSGSGAKPWTRNDVYALNAVKSELFGEGGGNEVPSSMLLNGLEAKLGASKGTSVWNDLREREDPETPVSIPGTFPYAPLPSKRTGNMIVDNGSFTPVDIANAPADAGRKEPPHASNILMVSGKRSASGHPVFVGGPQIGYFYPGLTYEVDLKGPHYQARGITSAPFPGYVLIGRREDFVWTLTSAGGDIIDEFVETLCGGSDQKYMYKGKCRSMERFDAGTLDGKPAVFYRTVHGPVVGYATVNGRRVAVSRKRSSYLRDATDQLLFQKLTRGTVRSANDFFKAAYVSPQTFNTFYANDRETGMITTGRLPIRAPGVDSGLPTNGNGKYEWRGFLAGPKHPHGIVKSGVLNNWNNKPARGFPAADDQQSYGSIHRVDLLNTNTAKVKKHTPATLVGAMNASATQDVRAITFTPLLARVLKGGPAPSPRAQQMLDILQTWTRNGGSRLDRNDDGSIDDAGTAIMDAAWDRLANAAMTPLLGAPLGDQLARTFMSRYQLPPGGQAAGWHVYMDKDLRTLLGDKVKGKFANRYCGLGNLAQCRADLWAALDAAGNDLAAAQGPDPTLWRSDARRERIQFLPRGLFPITIAYTNRPSGVQQVLEFDGHRPAPAKQVHKGKR
jgi:acyl-homoserine lactone acylase PvdQ